MRSVWRRLRRRWPGRKADGIAAAVASAAGEVADVNADLHASADYRKAMIPVFVRRAVRKGASEGLRS